MDADEFYLAWLARECRFNVSIHFAPKTRLGYRLVRRVVVSPKDEPALNMWLISKGIPLRILKRPEIIRELMALLSPVREHIKDKQGMLRMAKTLDIPRRGMTHERLFSLVSLF